MKDTRKLSTLHGWKDNPRNITTKDYERLKLQIKKLGQYKPILITKDGEVIGGNMRLKAYKELGITDVWVSELDPKDENQKLEYALSDNDRAGYYDDDLLANLIPNYDIDWSQYAVDMKPPEDIQALIDRIAPVEEDESPEVAEGEAVSKLGEVYQLGRHRLMCGDSTNLDDIFILMDMGRAKADMVFTDPPYGVDFQSNMRTKTDKFDVLQNDNVMLTDWIAPAVMYSTGWLLFCTTWKVLDKWLEIGKQIGELSNMIIWDKGGGGIGDLGHSLLTDYEIILAYNRGNKITGKRIGSVWSVGKDSASSYAHPTQKPVGLAGLAIKTFSSGNILDLFGGSGSTLIACEQTNRICYMMELDPKYCDVIRKRYAKFIGKEESWQAL